MNYIQSKILLLFSINSDGDRLLMGSDSPPGYFETPQGFYVQISVDEPEKAECVFHALAENGKVKMLIEQTFWSVRFGMLLDAAKNILTLNSDGPAMTGDEKMAKYRDVIEFKSDNHQVMTSHVLGDDGEWRSSFVSVLNNSLIVLPISGLERWRREHRRHRRTFWYTACILSCH